LAPAHSFIQFAITGVHDLIRCHTLNYTAVSRHIEMCAKFSDVFPTLVGAEHCEMDTVWVD